LFRQGACTQALVPESRFPPLPEGAAPPPLKDRRVLVAVENSERLERILCMLSGLTNLSPVAIEGLDHAVKVIDGELHGGFTSVHEAAP